MKEQSQTEENYLKAIYKLSKIQPTGISTKSISELLKIKSPTVSDMLKKLAAKKLINYEKYKGAQLTSSGEKVALKVIRKHRLWETFLVAQLSFKWDEVHDIAEQLEHIYSPELVDRLDKFLGFPKTDPHGDPIPDKDGNIEVNYQLTLDKIKSHEKVHMVGVNDHTSEFLNYLDGLKMKLGSLIEVVAVTEYDGSLSIKLDKSKTHHISEQVAKNIFVK
jgi:DtxR family transcriptional regulator, Mn-dependent transcriptional regulator